MDSVMVYVLSIIPFYQPHQDRSRYAILLKCLFYRLYFPVFYWYCRPAIVLAYLWNLLGELILLPYLIHSSYGDACYLPCLVGCPSLVLSPYCFYQFPFSKFHTKRKLIVGK